MTMQQRLLPRLRFTFGAAACALLLGACGGGGGGDSHRDATNTPVATAKPTLKVFGDSLMDSGTFGFEVTIQSADKSHPFLIFPEVVASSLGASTPCPYFNYAVTSILVNPACGNYAVSGGRINTRGDSTAAIDTATPASILNQISTGSALLVASDMVIVDGGANDLADLASAYLGATTPKGINTFTSKLATVLPPATVAALVTNTPTAGNLNAAALAYAQAVAQQLVQSVNEKIVAKGVRKVVVINAVDITTTPLVAGILATVAATQGTAQRDSVQGAVQAWTGAFNTTLAKGFTSASVRVIDVNSQFSKILVNPAPFGLTNTTTPACPKVDGGLDIAGLASLSQLPTVLACNVANLSSHIPVGETSATWWQSYAFSDDFHPTPALHGLIGVFIVQQLQQAGWIAPG
jgi:outer membrane lipase/esterase